MDLIAGLPKDDPPDFRYTLDDGAGRWTRRTSPSTRLALKKGSRLMMERQGLPDGEAVGGDARTTPGTAHRSSGYRARTISTVRSTCPALWRTSAGANRASEGLYNICIMEELHSILAAGRAAALPSSPIPPRGKVVRLTNPKYPQRVHGTHRPAHARDKDEIWWLSSDSL